MSFVITTDDGSYDVVRDTVVDFRALIVGRAIDELTMRPPLDRARVVATLRGVSPDAPGERARFARTSGLGGTFALSGVPESAFPDLATTPHVVDLVLDAPGYLHTPVAVPVPMGTTAFPIEIGDVKLRRDAVALNGSVTSGVPPTGVNNATVSVVAPAGLVGLQSPLSFEHANGLQVTPQALNAAGPVLDLTDDVRSGATRLPLARRTGLAANAVVRIGSGAITEYRIVSGLDGPSDLARPGAARLRAPLAFPHRADAGPARRVTTGAATAPASLVLDAFAEDRVAFVDDPTLLPDGSTALVDHADPQRVEWVVVRRAEATTDSAGDYRILPVGRTASVTVHVTPPAGPPPPDQKLVLSYTQPENVLNLRL